VTGRTKTEIREKLKKLQAEADAGLKTSASYMLAKAVEDWALRRWTAGAVGVPVAGYRTSRTRCWRAR